jgi:iron complex transport system substrate-binding protein
MKFLTALLCSLLFVSNILPVSAEIIVTDDLGNEVIIAAPAAKIISLAPHLTELLFSLGVGDRIKGTSRYSDYPAAAKMFLALQIRRA